MSIDVIAIKTDYIWAVYCARRQNTADNANQTEKKQKKRKDYNIMNSILLLYR